MELFPPLVPRGPFRVLIGPRIGLYEIRRKFGVFFDLFYSLVVIVWLIAWL